MRHFTGNQKRNGELAIRTLSEKARWYYDNTSRLSVWEHQIDVASLDEEPCYITVYAVNNAGYYCEALSKEELEHYLEEGYELSQD